MYAKLDYFYLSSNLQKPFVIFQDGIIQCITALTMFTFRIPKSTSRAKILIFLKKSATRTWFLDITSLQHTELSRMSSGSFLANVNEKSRGMPRTTRAREDI